MISISFFEIMKFYQGPFVQVSKIRSFLIWNGSGTSRSFAIYISVARSHLIFWAQYFDSKIAVIWRFSMLAFSLSLHNHTKIFSCQLVSACVCGAHVSTLFCFTECVRLFPFFLNPFFFYFCSRFCYLCAKSHNNWLDEYLYTSHSTRKTVYLREY